MSSRLGLVRFCQVRSNIYKITKNTVLYLTNQSQSIRDERVLSILSRDNPFKLNNTDRQNPIRVCVDVEYRKEEMLLLQTPQFVPLFSCTYRVDSDFDRNLDVVFPQGSR